LQRELGEVCLALGGHDGNDSRWRQTKWVSFCVMAFVMIPLRFTCRYCARRIIAFPKARDTRPLSEK
jgi:hypothetical protein